ncbi:LacI family DNA-binding transcriptional regulator [Marinivivus vitaminiproducens]|uniref:LacI family DNA-binding transcriptional regulator n=1 Tax=Marinivivus vitaminiproducens TaxID=3035935 RepID=UPI0027A1D401|nr:LacI family DNA-binding transcriptional regulator [Geminicoccaceae bacterium SCSIO 64248]
MTGSSVARRPNQADVALKAGVSISTVSRALANAPGISPAVRRRIQATAAELGYKPRAAEIAPGHLAVAFVPLRRATDGLGTFYEHILDGLKTAARDTEGVDLETRLIDEATLSPEVVTTHLEATGANCLFFIGIDPPLEVAAWLRAQGIAVVLINGSDPDLEVSSVAPANFYGAKLATRHLLSAGHRHIVHLTPANRWTILERMRGFQAAIGDVDGAVGHVRVIPDGNGGSGREAVLPCLAEHPECTAFFCMNDLVAIGVLQGLELAGKRVPHDVSVIGFDDLPVAAMTSPRLATMRVDRRAIGREALRLLHHRLAEPNSFPLQIEIGVRLVPGDSVGRPRTKIE